MASLEGRRPERRGRSSFEGRFRGHLRMTVQRRGSTALERDLNRWAAADGLINNAISLGQLEQLIELVGRGIGVEVEPQPDLRKADRGLLGDAERAAKIEIAFGRHRSGTQWNVERG